RASDGSAGSAPSPSFAGARPPGPRLEGIRSAAGHEPGARPAFAGRNGLAFGREQHSRAVARAASLVATLCPPVHAPGKQSFYFSAEILRDVACEARRLDRSASWVLQRAWMSARREIGKLPARRPPGSSVDPPK